MFYQEGSSLDLDLIVQNYQDERERTWAYDQTERNFLSLVDQLAGTLFRGVQALVQPAGTDQPHPFSWEQVRALTEQDAIADRVLERLEIDVAWEFCVETRAMARRALELARLVVTVQPNASVMGFLRRLSRCYIAGFHPECIILCRGVLENAMIAAATSKNQPRTSMSAMITNAHTRGWLSEQNASAAREIWRRGNRAVHEDPEAIKEAFETIVLTTKVLQELFGIELSDTSP